jgi:ParB family chromosome partitioning protein
VGATGLLLLFSKQKLMKNHLGRGLESLIPPKKSSQNTNANQNVSDDGQNRHARSHQSVFLVEIGKIKPNPEQPRKDFDPAELESLAKSIKEHGVLQPIVVAKVECEREGGGRDVEYQIIAGERRWRAAQMAGFPHIPAIIHQTVPTEKDLLKLALIENLQRHDLNPIEEALAYSRLQEEFNLIQKEIAEMVGRSREAVANAVRLLNLPAEIQTALREGRLSEGHARILVSLDNSTQQINLYKSMLVNPMTVRDLEERVRQIKKFSKIETGADPRIRNIKNKLEEILGAKVNIQPRSKGGRIAIEYYSDEELKNILDKIMGE